MSERESSRAGGAGMTGSVCCLTQLSPQHHRAHIVDAVLDLALGANARVRSRVLLVQQEQSVMKHSARKEQVRGKLVTALVVIGATILAGSISPPAIVAGLQTEGIDVNNYQPQALQPDDSAQSRHDWH